MLPIDPDSDFQLPQTRFVYGNPAPQGSHINLNWKSGKLHGVQGFGPCTPITRQILLDQARVTGSLGYTTAGS